MKTLQAPQTAAPSPFKLRMDANGNKTLYLGNRRKIQTNGNLLQTHRDGLGPWTAAEVAAHLAATAPRPHRVFINRKGGGYLETVDEFETRIEARAMLKEYTLADPAGHHYLSSRACKGWDA